MLDRVARIYFETYGCQMNEADSRFIAERALDAGYEITADVDRANVVVVNTCTVRENAEQRAYGRLAALKTAKVHDPSLRIVVSGCLAEQDRDRLRIKVPHVDALFGTRELVQMGEQIAAWAGEFGDADATAEELVAVREILEPLRASSASPSTAFTHLRAYINVQFGCSYYCTYCIVPHVRGRFVHRPLSEILAETSRRIAEGAREITLVGQTVNAYIDPESGADFATLLRRTAEVPGLERLGFITSHPNDLSDELIAAFASIPQLNPRFHLALQSGSNPVLKRMNRKYTIEKYLERITAFRRACPDWALTTDIIAGFPGENEADFDATMHIIERGYFAQVYAFIYSPRRGTPAAKWDPVEPTVASARHARLMTAVNAHVHAYHAAKVGTRVRALLEGPSKKNAARVAAKTGDNVTIIAPYGGSITALLETPWLDIEIEQSFTWGCLGRLVGVAASYGAIAQAPPTPFIDLLAV